MSEAKPGDIARIIRDPEAADGKTNVGKQVFVVEVFQPRNLTQLLMQCNEGVLYEVEPLQPLWAHGNAYSDHRTLTNPGDRIICAKGLLQRIDPPAGTEALYTASPVVDDLDVALHSLEKALSAFLGESHAPSR